MKVIVFFLSLMAPVFAQTSGTTGVFGSAIGPPSGQVIMANGAVEGGTTVSVRAVTGMPYSAQEVTERVQTLADGTRIADESPKVTYYRDSMGRTRTERTFALPPGLAAAGVTMPSTIEINDPVSGARYTLNPRTHTARSMTFAVPRTPQPLATPVLTGQLPAPAVIPAQTERPQMSHESLGTQTIEGVLAQGQRNTTVYPVGFFGNDRPVTIVNETWMSPDLKIMVLSKNSDPRSGESTTRLTNISRGEPDPSLFQVPPDYEIVKNGP